MHHISGTVHHLTITLRNICKMIISPGVFIIFFKILIVCAVKGIKGQKIAQDEK